MNVHDEIVAVVQAHLDVFAEVEALDVEMRRSLNADARRQKLPWILNGRPELAVEELRVWRSLHSGELTKANAIICMQSLMSSYYS